MTIVFIIRFITFMLGYHLLGAFINVMYWDYIINHPKPNLKIGKYLAMIFIPLIYLFSKKIRNMLK